MSKIEIRNENGYTIDEARLMEAAARVLAQHDEDPETGLTIVITDNDYVAQLNRQFRGVDAPTDVLSFPAEAPPEEIIDDEPPYLGDLVIAHPYATAQAQHEGHDVSDSFALLVVHGTLHLLGYDHDTQENRAEMWAAQERALIALNISPAIVPALEGEFLDGGQAE
jgi:probable rRNA maturation factor